VSCDQILKVFGVNVKNMLTIKPSGPYLPLKFVGRSIHKLIVVFENYVWKEVVAIPGIVTEAGTSRKAVRN